MDKKSPYQERIDASNGTQAKQVSRFKAEDGPEASSGTHEEAPPWRTRGKPRPEKTGRKQARLLRTPISSRTLKPLPATSHACSKALARQPPPGWSHAKKAKSSTRFPNPWPTWSRPFQRSGSTGCPIPSARSRHRPLCSPAISTCGASRSSACPAKTIAPGRKPATSAFPILIGRATRSSSFSRMPISSHRTGPTSSSMTAMAWTNTPGTRPLSMSARSPVRCHRPIFSPPIPSSTRKWSLPMAKTWSRACRCLPRTSPPARANCGCASPMPRSSRSARTLPFRLAR
jgi:hypothetical protein